MELVWIVLVEEVLQLWQRDEAVLVLVVLLPDVAPDVFPTLEVGHHDASEHLLVYLEEALGLDAVLALLLLVLHVDQLLHLLLVGMVPRLIEAVHHHELAIHVAHRNEWPSPLILEHGRDASHDSVLLDRPSIGCLSPMLQVLSLLLWLLVIVLQQPASIVILRLVDLVEEFLVLRCHGVAGVLSHHLGEITHCCYVFGLGHRALELVPLGSWDYFAELEHQVAYVILDNLLMQQAVLTSLVIRVVFPAVFVDARDRLAQLHVLPEEERLLRQDLEPYRVFKVLEADLLVLVRV